MKHLRYLFLFFPFLLLAQQETKIIAYLEPDKGLLKIEQTLVITNNSAQSWDRVVLLDWANSFSNVETALANRFAEDFKNRFQFAKEEDRGKTVFPSLNASADYSIRRLSNQKDVVELVLDQPLSSGSTKTFVLNYEVTIPEDDFTDYGRTNAGEYNLKFWYLHPAVFADGEWQYYSHKDLNDFYGAPLDYTISLHLPTNLFAFSTIPLKLEAPTDTYNSYLFEGKGYKEAHLYLRKKNLQFKKYKTDQLTIISDLKDDNLSDPMKIVVLNKIADYLTQHLGPYPHEELVISTRYYKESPVYGLSSLPNFINPFPDGFSYEVQMLKAMTRKWVESGYLINPRDEFWLQNAITIYTLMKYQEDAYPDLKIAGKFSKVWGLRSFNAAKLKFNDQYPLLFLNTVRLNLDQALTTPGDSLVKYNQELGIPYKAGVGFMYLDDYLNDDALEKTIKQLYNGTSQDVVGTEEFQQVLNSNTDQTTNWFFDDFISTHVRMDWKIRSVRKNEDSLVVKLKNKSGRMLPVPFYQLRNDTVISKEWIPAFARDTTITLSRKRADRIAINYEQLIPEFSQRDNYRTLKNFPSVNRPLRFKLLKDVEDPTKT